jgi:hypothetical protein
VTFPFSAICANASRKSISAAAFATLDIARSLLECLDDVLALLPGHEKSSTGSGYIAATCRAHDCKRQTDYQRTPDGVEVRKPPSQARGAALRRSPGRHAGKISVYMVTCGTLLVNVVLGKGMLHRPTADRLSF